MKQSSTLKNWLAGGLLMASIGTSLAVPARPGLMTVMQPDGTELQVRLIGDENGHYYLSEDGYLLVNSGDTFYFGEIDSYGRPVASELQALSPDKRSEAEIEFLSRQDRQKTISSAVEFLGSHRVASSIKSVPSKKIGRQASERDAQPGIGRFPGSHFPSIGEQRAIVILVEYQDMKFVTENPLDYFSRMLNEEGFNTLGGTGSARDFFIENSNGLFRPSFDIYGPVTLKENMAYYGANDIYGADVRPHEMAIEACEQLDPDVDFSQYDRDGDGFIDNVFIYYAGRGEATGGSSNTIWPHSWTLSVAEPDKVFEYDGVRLESYGCTNEWDVNKGVERPDAIGVFVHEFSHVLGLPDLYNTVDQNACFTPGAWSTLDAGPYNNNSCTPPHYGAFERYALGWMTPEVVDKPATVTLSPISENRAILIPTSKEEEFFLLENRQQNGWDSYLPGHGMLVWHIDYNESVWEHNSVNNRTSHQYVDLEEADDILNDATRSGDAFPGTAGVTSFTEATSPSMLPWTNESLDLPITDIAEHDDGTVTFLVAGGFILPDKGVALEPQEIGHDSFTACWAASENALGYRLSVFKGTADRSQAPLPDWNERDLGNSLSAMITDLTPEESYTYSVIPYNRCGDGESSDLQSVRTLAFTFDRKMPVALEAVDINHDSFTARWEEMEGAVAYTLDVYSKKPGRTETEVCDFTDGTKATDLPAGWTSTSEASFAMASYSGDAIPALRLGNDGDMVESGDYGNDVMSVSFWLRGSGTDEKAAAIVTGKCGDEWVEIGRADADKSIEGRTVAFDVPMEDVTAIRIYFEKGQSGSLAIDDITVTYCADKEKVGFNSYEISDSSEKTSFKVEGLMPETTYFYTVSGNDGSLQSLPSQEIRVRTTDASGVATVAVGDISVMFAGDIVTVSCDADIEVELMDMWGCVVARKRAADGVAMFHVASKGIYVVRAGGNSVKISI